MSRELTKHIPISPVPLRTGVVFRTSSTAVQLFRWLVAASAPSCASFHACSPAPTVTLPTGASQKTCFSWRQNHFVPETRVPGENLLRIPGKARTSHTARRRNLRWRPSLWAHRGASLGGRAASASGDNGNFRGQQRNKFPPPPPEAVSRGVDTGDPKVTLRPLPTQPPRGWYVRSSCWFPVDVGRVARARAKVRLRSKA